MTDKTLGQLVVSARVTMTVEMDLGMSWAESCPFSQVEKQAREEALKQLHRTMDATPRRIRVVGDPCVTAVLVERSRA